MSLQRGINLRALAEKMGQCSGAEVRGICTEAGMLFILSKYPRRMLSYYQVCTRFVSVDNTLHRRTLSLRWPRCSRRTKREIPPSTSSSHNHCYCCTSLWDLIFQYYFFDEMAELPIAVLGALETVKNAVNTNEVNLLIMTLRY